MLAPSATTDATQPPTVRAMRLDGQVVAGEWSGIEQGKVVLKGAVDGLPLAELLEIAWPVAQTQPAAASAPAENDDDLLRIYLHDGTQTNGRIVSGDAHHVTFATPDAGKLTIPFTALAAIAWPAARQEAARQAFQQAMAKPDADKDVLLVLAGDKVQVLRGAAESLSPDGGTFRWRDRAVPLHSDRTCALIFARPLAAPQIAPALCTLRDGTLWAGQLTAADANVVHLSLSGGGEITLPVEHLRAIRLNSDRVVFLSDLDPVEEHFEPFGATAWPYRKDRSVTNAPLCIGSQTYERGIGVHSQSRLVYALDGKYRQLAGEIGIDAAVGQLGNVVFRVLADGKEVFNSGPVRGGEAPRPLRVSVENASRLELCVDFGEDLDIGDQANWAAVRLVR